ncbi:hypothetical protein ACHAXM_004061 [Skeletonema potamos]
MSTMKKNLIEASLDARDESANDLMDSSMAKLAKAPSVTMKFLTIDTRLSLSVPQLPLGPLRFGCM